MFHPNILSNLQFYHPEKWFFTMEGNTGSGISVVGCGEQERCVTWNNLQNISGVS